MNIFIINLPKSVDRREYMENLCLENGLEPTIIEAVDGKTLSQNLISTVCNQQKAKQNMGRELMLGEIGCALSHKKIYQKMVDEDIDIALVLEDDVRFEPLLNKVLSSTELFPNTWELVLLGHYAGHDKQKEITSPMSFWDSHRINEEIKLGRLASYGYGTHGYLINQQGAKKLLKELEIIHRPIDHYTADDMMVNTYAITPTVIKVQQQFETLIDENSVRGEIHLSLMKRLLSKINLLSLLQVINKLRKRLQFLRAYKK